LFDGLHDGFSFFSPARATNALASEPLASAERPKKNIKKALTPKAAGLCFGRSIKFADYATAFPGRPLAVVGGNAALTNAYGEKAVA
jgi:hypothetical protein